MNTPRGLSPLRYPGGKACLYPLTSEILRINSLEKSHYAEPYAGGCGLALALLIEGHVGNLHLNDLDPAVWSFWNCVLNRTEELVDLVRNTEISPEEWRRQKSILTSCDAKDVLRLGFATLFLNRTNRSGIIKSAGMIGGSSQAGTYKINCRFNKEEIVQRIVRVAKYRNRIKLYNMDGVEFMKRLAADLQQDAFFYIDPPYFNKGSSLYANFYGKGEHRAVARAILTLKVPYVVTYDLVGEIRDLYAKRRQFALSVNYSANAKRLGSEVLVASAGLKIPAGLRSKRLHSTAVLGRQVAA